MAYIKNRTLFSYKKDQVLAFSGKDRKMKDILFSNVIFFFSEQDMAS